LCLPKGLEQDVSRSTRLIYLIALTIIGYIYHLILADGHSLHDRSSSRLSAQLQHIIINIIILQSDWIDLGQPRGRSSTGCRPGQLDFISGISLRFHYLQVSNYIHHSTKQIRVEMLSEYKLAPYTPEMPRWDSFQGPIWRTFRIRSLISDVRNHDGGRDENNMFY